VVIFGWVGGRMGGRIGGERGFDTKFLGRNRGIDGWMDGAIPKSMGLGRKQTGRERGKGCICI
jgi:hypothetical protein